MAIRPRKRTKMVLPPWTGVAAVVAAVLVVVLIFGLGYIYDIRRETALAASLTVVDQDLSSVHNGVYYGSHKLGNTLYSVEVTINNYTITNIKVVSNRRNKYAKMAEGVIQNVMAKGNVDVDTIAGATASSKALLKAIEQAIACNL